MDGSAGDGLENAVEDLKLDSRSSSPDSADERQADAVASPVLHQAVQRRDSRGIQQLLMRSDYAAINRPDEIGRTALHLAVEENCIQAVQLLLRGGANPSVKDLHGNHALHYACVRGASSSIVQELLDSLSVDDVIEQNADGCTPLMLACTHGHLEIVQILLDRDTVRMGINLVDNKRQTALHLAAHGTHSEIVKLLVQNKANVNRRDCSKKAGGESPLHIAVRKEDVTSIRALLAANADPSSMNIYGETSLYIAAKAGSALMVEMLLGNSPGDGDEDGNDAESRPRLREGVKVSLIVAIRMGNQQVVRSLLRHFDGLDLKSAVLAASMAGNEAIMTSLLARVSSDFLQFSECVDCCCQSLAQHAVILGTRYGHLEVLRLLVDAGCPVDIKFSCSRTLLHEAALNGHAHLARFLLNAGVKINARDYFGRTPLMDAVCSNKVNVIQVIVEYVEEQGSRQRRSSLSQLGLGESVIMGQCLERPWKFKNSKTLELLNASDYAGSTYMHMAASRGHLDVIKFFLTCGCPIVNSRDGHMSTPLHSAVHARRIGVTQCLIKNGAALDPEDTTGATPLVYAIRNVDTAMVVLLINSGCSLDKIRSTLQPPVTYGPVLTHPVLVSVLVASGAKPHDLKYLASGFRDGSEASDNIMDQMVNRLLCQPLSLKFMTRIAIRSPLIGATMHDKVQQLPLPELMKSFILLEELA